MKKLIEEFKDSPVVFVVITLFCLGVVFFIIDAATNTYEFDSGKIIDKHYREEVNRTGTGIGATTGGNGAFVVTTEHQSEKYLLKVARKDGNIKTVESTPEIYYYKEIGDSIVLVTFYGGITGFVYGTRAHK